MGMTSLGLYVHVPFCRSKCGYCDFYSVPMSEQWVGPLLKAVRCELAGRLSAHNRPITTIFVGGGTPTVLSAANLQELLRPLHELVRRDRPAEFTVEANPGTLDDAKLARLVEAGVDRVSLGAQSFHPEELAVLERVHSPWDIAVGVQCCRRQGIERINLDLIFGIPGQTPARWRESLRRAIDLGVEHLACYGLTYELGTRLTARRDRVEIVPCPEELEIEMYLAAIDDLAAAGYGQYEISSFAKPCQRCLHNLIYWRNEPYIGVGPSAAGYFDGVRYKNIPDLEGYVAALERQGHAVVESECLTGPAFAGETAMLRLRLNEGLVFKDFLARTGMDAREAFTRSIAHHAAKGWLAITETGIALTRAGRLVANTVTADFLAEANEQAERVT